MNADAIEVFIAPKPTTKEQAKRGEGLPSGTPDQLALFDAIYRGEVSGYPGHTRPITFWNPSMLDERDATARANRLLGAELVAWEPAWRPGADKASKYQLQPTNAGLAWRERVAARERRAAERRRRAQ